MKKILLLTAFYNKTTDNGLKTENLEKMTFKSIISSLPGWLSSEGPESGIVISSRTRLARNIAGILYAHRADDEKLGEVVNNELMMKNSVRL